MEGCSLCSSSLLYLAVGLLLVSRLHVYRSLRRYETLFALVFLLYRAQQAMGGSVVPASLLEELSQALQALHAQYAQSRLSAPLLRLCGDALALLALREALRLLRALVEHAKHLRGAKKALFEWCFSLVKDLSLVRDSLQSEQRKLEQSFDKELKLKARALGEINAALPAEGVAHAEVLSLMRSATEKENTVWERGHLSGSVYHGQRAHQDFLNACFALYSLSNPLHPDIWPSVMKFESEIIAMTASLVRGYNKSSKNNNNSSNSTVSGDNESLCGCTTSGGTESIILAIKAHRDYYRARYGITEPELICAVSAHAAVDKACDMMNIKLIKVDVHPHTFRIDLSAVKRAIGPNTIMLYASAPSYPHGAVDPVREMSKLAVKYKIGLHVDCCLGGFVLPFAKKAGFQVADFDFSLPGVSTMSLDTHKYGYALKGSSVLLFRDRELRHAAYFCYADWTGGMYTTPTIAGSRSGGIIAQTWASLMAMGESGYVKHAKDILETTRLIAEGVKKIDGITLLGEVDAMIVCFGGTEGVNVYSVSDQMHRKGWSLNALQHPPCVHLCVTVTHVGHHEEFLQDLEVSVMEVKKSPDNKSGNAAIYGMTSALPPGPVNELLKVYNDVVLKM